MKLLHGTKNVIYPCRLVELDSELSQRMLGLPNGK
jgi:hypothetical protein